MNKYVITVKEGPLLQSYIATRNGRYFHFNDSAIGCSVIEYRNKALIDYTKITEEESLGLAKDLTFWYNNMMRNLKIPREDIKMT